ncbi:hypothetical protein ILYODFUR_033972 [Ilyodon furcidens]|uniref:Secreted protein n=2 Tax=Goodeidae TaxID=28758 RepID=A0ABU7E6T2_9TELE|nr:hypothetical protein [Characodon lateralis]
MAAAAAAADGNWGRPWCVGRSVPGALNTLVVFLRFFHLARRFWNQTCGQTGDESGGDGALTGHVAMTSVCHQYNATCSNKSAGGKHGSGSIRQFFPPFCTHAWPFRLLC